MVPVGGIVMSRLGVKFIVAFDLGSAVNVAYENCKKYENIEVVKANIFHMPFKNKFDFVFSLGVIHHTPDPELAFYKLSEKTKKYIYCWVYGYENNGWIVSYVNPIRKYVTSKLPFHMLKIICFFITVILHPFLKIFYKKNCISKFLPYRDYLKWLGAFNFSHTFHVVFDHLVTPIAFYISRSEIMGWNKKASFSVFDVVSRNNNSWRVFGEK